MPTTIRLDLRAVGYQEGRRWISHCLELDVVGQGDTPRESFVQLVELIALQVQAAAAESDAGSVFFPAPREIFELFSRAKDTARPRVSMPKQVGRLDFRAMALA